MSTQTHAPAKHWYDRSYKLILIIPALLLLFSFFLLYHQYQTTGDFIHKDVSLTGGVSISIFDSSLSVTQVTTVMDAQFPGSTVRAIADVRTGEQKGITVESQGDQKAVQAKLEELLGYPLTSANSSIEFSGAVLSEQFYQQLLRSLAVAFLGMALVVYLIFGEQRTLKMIAVLLSLASMVVLLPGIQAVSALCWIVGVSSLVYGLIRARDTKERFVLGGVALVSVLVIFFSSMVLVGLVSLALLVLYTWSSIPSAAVVAAAFADMVMTLALVNLLDIQLSVAGIIAFLMLIGYSVDTDILLTTRLLREREGSVNRRIWEAFKTGLTMTLTAIVAVGVSLYFVAGLSSTLEQMFTIILIGLGFDIVNTWVTNAGLLKWYMEVKRLS